MNIDTGYPSTEVVFNLLDADLDSELPIGALYDRLVTRIFSTLSNLSIVAPVTHGLYYIETAEDIRFSVVLGMTATHYSKALGAANAVAKLLIDGNLDVSVFVYCSCLTDQPTELEGA